MHVLVSETCLHDCANSLISCQPKKVCFCKLQAQQPLHAGQNDIGEKLFLQAVHLSFLLYIKAIICDNVHC